MTLAEIKAWLRAEYMFMGEANIAWIGPLLLNFARKVLKTERI